MPAEQTLRRAQEELDAGRIVSARQRLQGLVGSEPHNIRARELLAECYRRSGDVAQAGRWAYATDVVSESEQAAFARAFADDPVQMMRALRWTGDEDAASSERATDRLRRLRSRAEHATGMSQTWESPEHPTRDNRLATVLIAAVVLFLVVCLIVGIVTVIRGILNRL